jgi:hypothetical protein
MEEENIGGILLKKKTLKKKLGPKKKPGPKPGSPASSKSTESTLKKRNAFIEVFKRTGNITYAAEQVGINRTTHFTWMKKDPKYVVRFNSAREEAADVMEAEAWRRGVKGVDKPVFYRGEEVAKIKEYSDLLLIFLLKANRPEKFRDKVEHSGPGGGPIEQKVTIYIPENDR